MRVIINYRTECGGVSYAPEPYAQTVSDAVGAHLVSIGAAQELETKVVEVPEVKKHLSSEAGQASQPPIVKKRGRPAKQ